MIKVHIILYDFHIQGENCDDDVSLDDKIDINDRENSFENDSNISVDDVESSPGSVKNKNDEVCFAWRGVIKVLKTNRIDNKH